MIPKEIFFFWSGAPMSWMRYMTLYSFRKLNPDWKMTVCICSSAMGQKQWPTRETQDFCEYSGEDYFARISELNINIQDVSKALENLNAFNPVYRSDIFRWMRLSSKGGLYADMDILFVKPINSLYEKIRNSTVMCCYGRQNNTQKNYHSIGFLGCSPSNIYYGEVYNYVIKKIGAQGKQDYQMFGSRAVAACWRKYRQQILAANFSGALFYNLPMQVVYPFSWEDTSVFDVCQTVLPNDCVGVHWFAGHPNSQKYNSVLTEKTVHTYTNTFSHFAKKIESI